MKHFIARLDTSDPEFNIRLVLHGYSNAGPATALGELVASLAANYSPDGMVDLFKYGTLTIDCDNKIIATVEDV